MHPTTRYRYSYLCQLTAGRAKKGQICSISFIFLLEQARDLCIIATTSKPAMNVSKTVCSGVALLSLLQLSNPIQAATVSIHPTADTTLQQAFSSNNYGDGTTFTAGGRRQGGRTRALLLFDIAGNIP